MSLRHDRRRRMLADEGASDAPEEVESGDRGTREGASSPRAYSQAVHRTLGRPIRDFFPSRLVGIGIVLGGGLMLVGAMAAGHVGAPQLWGQGDVGHGGLFDLSSVGNASSWFSSTMLTLAGITCLFLFALRRHRVDDYHGRYRVWLWASLACFVVSFGEVTNFAGMVRQVCDLAASASNVDSALAWRIAVASVLALCGVRLVLEMRRCRSAMALWSLTTLAVLGAAAAAHGWMTFAALEDSWAVARSCWLSAYVFLLGTLLVYARYVILEIEGKVAVKLATVRRTKRKKKIVRKETEPVESEAPRKELTPQHAHVRSPAATLKLSNAVESRHADRSDGRSDDADGQRGLSRKERRKLRRAA
jgi:hypothetical protein